MLKILATAGVTSQPPSTYSYGTNFKIPHCFGFKLLHSQDFKKTWPLILRSRWVRFELLRFFFLGTPTVWILKCTLPRSRVTAFTLPQYPISLLWMRGKKEKTLATFQFIHFHALAISSTFDLTAGVLFQIIQRSSSLHSMLLGKLIFCGLWTN